ncbi:MAG: glutamate--tRNA ligase [Firmicutes bacterium]|nr:glutamate--tRNA ligase [Bacillota bacterium]
MNKIVRTRFAPSPTGYLHIGGLRTALYAYLFAKQNGGRFILRLEDTDQNRLVDGADKVIYDALKDAGLVYDEGPDVGGEYGPYIQSERKEIYNKYADELIKKGGAYYCFCDAGAKQNDGEIAKYNKACLNLTKVQIEKNLAAKKSFVIRQNMPAAGVTTYTDLVFGDITIENKELEDNVLIKSDGLPTYNFANVIDDHLMGITHVMRGVEYLSSTPKYNHIYDAFSWKKPQYMHLQNIMKDANQKLSKRHGAASYEDFIKKGFIKEGILNYIALLGWSPKGEQEKFSLAELADKFNIEGLSKSPAIFDEVKMRYINALHIKDLSLEEYHDLALPFYSDKLKEFDLKFLSNLLHSRTEIFSDIIELTRFIIEFDGYDLCAFINEKMKTDINLAKEMLPKLINFIDGKDWDNIADLISEFADKENYKKGQVMWIFRIALTGAKNTPGGAIEMAMLFKRDKGIKRIKESLERIKL